MQGSRRYLVALFLLLFASCSKKQYIPVRINPIEVNFSGDIELLQEKLRKRNIVLAYENSYEGEANGIKKFYFDDENDGLHYHIVVYTLNDEINGVEAEISSHRYAKDKLYSKVENGILIDFKKSVLPLKEAAIKVTKDTLWDGRGIYYFDIVAQILNDKMH